MEARSVLEQFSRKVGHLIGSGIPLVTALEITCSEVDDSQFLEVLKHVVELLKDGKSFSAALEQYPGYFSKSFVGLAKVGEQQGNLDLIMEKIAEGLKTGSVVPGSGVAAAVHPQSAKGHEAVDALLKEAIEAGASDIHLLPGLDENLVQFRIDGKLKEIRKIPQNDYPGIVARIKIMGCLDVAEQQLPQDGRILIQVENKRFDIRIGVMPVVIGEKVTLKILSKEKNLFTPEALFVIPQEIDNFKEMVAANYGLIVFTGPAGSGKTTTQYCAVNECVTKRGLSVATIEDPVEYLLDGTFQLRIRPEIGLTWKMGLSAIMRHDPDVVMVGEVRDESTVEMVVKIAMTGHLVLAGFPAFDTADAIRRLLYYKVPTHVLGSILVGVVSQKLVRKVCPDCAKPAKISASELKLLALPETAQQNLKEGKGCKKCQFSGYRGRVALNELFRPGNSFKDSLLTASPEEISSLLEKEAFPRFRETAAELLSAGITSKSEIKRILFSAQ